MTPLPEGAPVECVLVTHTHWDREWYRTFEAFRARLVDTIDRVLELLADDPGYRFVLDGQAIVVEDYLAVRPDRADELAAACRAGRLGLGPWYVQPDSLLPSGESHVRNLLEGRRVVEELGPCSTVAYTPDSFGHPAQFPQLFGGFRLAPFLYWRGNGTELDDLGGTYTWVGPDGSRLPACHLGSGYFAAAYLPDGEGPDDVGRAVKRLRRLGEQLVAAGHQRVLFMNGVDHAPPEPRTGVIADALATASGWTVRRGLLDDFADGFVPGPGEHHSELLGARSANLLPGVWSSRLGLKLADRRADAVLTGWAEPFAALAHVLGGPDERPSLRIAWRALLANQAHDSIGGCSADPVHEQMQARYATATELGEQTTARALERMAGAPVDRSVPWTDELDLAVFNPVPLPRTGVVRFPLDGVPTFKVTDLSADIHPLAMSSLVRAGFTVDGAPARVVPSADPARFRLMPEQATWDLEFVARDVPGFGYRRVHLAPADASPDEVDDGREITTEHLTVAVADDGTFTLRTGECAWAGLGAVVDEADRGDTYDFDALSGDEPVTQPVTVGVVRRRHVSGIGELVVSRTFAIPQGLTADRSARSDGMVPMTIVTTARVAPGVESVDVDVVVDNPARDHRLRLSFPTGAPVDTFLAATTFDTAVRSTAPPDATGWLHPAPVTFPHQGWIAANGLTVLAPGLPEGEVDADGTVFVTLLRAVGWLARMDLASRPVPAGPGLPTPGAQCLGSQRARIELVPGPPVPARLRALELGFRAVPAGPRPLVPEDTALVTLTGDHAMLSALKPTEDGDGTVVRILNPDGVAADAHLALGFDVREARFVRLDEVVVGPVPDVEVPDVEVPDVEVPDVEVPNVEVPDRDGRSWSLSIGPHALATVRLRT